MERLFYLMAIAIILLFITIGLAEIPNLILSIINYFSKKRKEN